MVLLPGKSACWQHSSDYIVDYSYYGDWAGPAYAWPGRGWRGIGGNAGAVYVNRV